MLGPARVRRRRVARTQAVDDASSRVVRRFVTPVLLLTLPLLLFVSLFHPATLDIGNAGWLLD